MKSFFSQVLSVLGLLSVLAGQHALAWPSPYNPITERDVNSLVESPVMKIVELENGVPKKLEISATVKKHKRHRVRNNHFFEKRFTLEPVQMLVETQPQYTVTFETERSGSFSVGSGETLVEDGKYIYRYRPDQSTIGATLGAPVAPSYDFELGRLVERDGALYLEPLAVNAAGLFACKYTHMIVGKTEAFRRFFTGWKFHGETMSCKISDEVFTGWFRANFCPAHKYCKL